MILFKAPGQKHKTVLEWSRSEVERPQREKYTGGRFLSRRPEPVKGESKGRTRERQRQRLMNLKLNKNTP